MPQASPQRAWRLVSFAERFDRSHDRKEAESNFSSHQGVDGYKVHFGFLHKERLKQSRHLCS